METLARLEKLTFGGKIEVRASALLYLLGVVDGLLEGESDTDVLVDLLIGGES